MIRLILGSNINFGCVMQGNHYADGGRLVPNGEEYVRPRDRKEDSQGIVTKTRTASEYYALGIPDGAGGRMVPFDEKGVLFVEKLRNSLYPEHPDKRRSKL